MLVAAFFLVLELHSAAALFATLAALACDTGNAATLPAQPAPAPASASATSVFAARSDDAIRKQLGAEAVARVTKGYGGRSLGFRLTLESGLQGYYKPEQTFGANWSSEIAAYHLDRELGLRRVPPAVGRRMPWELLRSHAGNDPRLGEVVVKNGMVRGSLVWWIPDELVPAQLPRDWPGWLRVERSMGVSPFQNPARYWREKRTRPEARWLDPPEPTCADRPAELSDLIVFDYLIGNLDRWGSGNTNVRVLGSTGALIYLDNANGFEPREPPSKLLEARLSSVQRFRKATVFAIRALDVKRLKERMAGDPLAPLLSDAQLGALEQRRQRVLEHVAACEEKFGARALPW